MQQWRSLTRFQVSMRRICVLKFETSPRPIQKQVLRPNFQKTFFGFTWMFIRRLECLYYFPENMDKNMKLWTTTWNCGQKFRVYLWTFKWTQKCLYNFPGKCEQKHEIVEKNFESTYEHLSEPKNVHTIFWKMWTTT